MVEGKKPKRSSKALKEKQKLDDITAKSEKVKDAAIEAGRFRKIAVDSDITVYYGKDKSFVHYKSNPTGFGGAELKLRLEDDTVESVKGAFFCPADLLGKYLGKNKQ